jgi:hypothetical protein
MLALMAVVALTEGGCGGSSARPKPHSAFTTVVSRNDSQEGQADIPLHAGPVLAFGYLPNGQGFDIRGGNTGNLPALSGLSAGLAPRGASGALIANGDQQGGSAIMIPSQVRGPMPFSGVFACSGEPKVLLVFGLLRSVTGSAYIDQGGERLRFHRVPLSDTGAMAGELVYAPVTGAATVVVARRRRVLLSESVASPQASCTGPGTPILMEIKQPG